MANRIAGLLFFINVVLWKDTYIDTHGFSTLPEKSDSIKIKVKNSPFSLLNVKRTVEYIDPLHMFYQIKN